MRATLGKNQRLKSLKLIREILSERRSVASFPLRLIWRETEKEKNTVAAFFAPKKYYRRAVDRNRVKRLMREVYRTSREKNLEKYDRSFAFIFLWTGREVPNFAEVNTRMEKVFARWHEKLNEKSE